MAPKRKQSSTDKHPKRRRIPPTLTPEQKRKRAEQRARLDQELFDLTQPFLDPDLILTLQPLRTEQEPTLSPLRRNVESWCSCGNCMALPTEEECLCCIDVRNVLNILEELESMSCITYNNMFRETCLCKQQLAVCAMYAGQEHSRIETVDNRTLRKRAYRLFTMWVHGHLGAKIRRPIPACVVKSVREAYPDESGRYVGFHYAGDYSAADMADA